MNEHRGYVAVQLGGRERKLRYSMNALCEVLNVLKIKSLGELSVALTDLRNMRSVLTIGLKEDDPSLDEMTVGSWDFPLMEVNEQMSKALALALGVKPEKKE